MIRIALDASGGDQAPDAPIDGALEALRDFPGSVKVTLVGRRAEVVEALEARSPIPEGIDIVDAPEIIGMAERPVQSVRSKRKSSRSFRFVGNVEGGDILAEKCDVFVCDGFVGNVVVKFYESVGRMFANLVKREFDQEMRHRKGMARLLRFLDYSSYGGAPLLGVRGVPIVCHGRSAARAIKNAIRVAVKAVENHLTRDIGEELAFGATG